MFKNFADAVKFSVKVAEVADEQDHHPKFIIEWGKVSIFWWTHSINGLHLNDFVMAAKINRIFKTVNASRLLPKSSNLTF